MESELESEFGSDLGPEGRIYAPGLGDDGPPRAGFSWVALAAVAVGVANFVILYLVGAPLALILGYHARKTIRSSGGRQSGLSVAWLGIALGWLGMAVNVYTFIVYNVK